MSTTSTVMLGASLYLDASHLRSPEQRRAAKRRGGVTLWERLAAVVWDSQFLRVQHAVHNAAPRLATHLDGLAGRRDEHRSKRPC